MKQIWNSRCAAYTYDFSTYTLSEDLSTFFSLHLFQMEALSGLIKGEITYSFLSLQSIMQNRHIYLNVL